MRTITTRFGVATMIAAAGIGSSQAISSAEPETHQVRYTVTTQVEANFHLYYLVNEPADSAAVEADPSAYFRNDRVRIAPGAPWVFDTTLTDTQWAIITAGSAHRVAPHPSCEILVDGEIVMQNGSESGAQCALRPW